MTYRVGIIGAGVWSESHMLGWRAQPVVVTWIRHSLTAVLRDA
jgi:hypothetical protein